MEHNISLCSISGVGICVCLTHGILSSRCSSLVKGSASNLEILHSFPPRDVMSSIVRVPPQPRLLRQIHCLDRILRISSVTYPFPRIALGRCRYPVSPRTFRRYAGTKVRKKLEELPQGLQAPLEPFVEKEASKYSPVIDEVLQNQRRFPKCILLTRVGQFYEARRFLPLS